MNNPLVSIIIPTYNRANLISETLDSIESDHPNWECIVVDDGSTDETENLLANYCATDKLFSILPPTPSNRPKAQNACRNYGFEQGSFRIDDDDVMLEDFKDKSYCIY
jgi:glycosyltransferase involved in cell wall biosynthesis